MGYSSEESVGESITKSGQPVISTPLPVGTNSEEQALSEAELILPVEIARAASRAEDTTEDVIETTSETTDELLASHDGSQAVMSDIILDIPGIAFRAARTGDTNLLEVLLGPSLPDEKKQFIKLLLERHAIEEEMRIFEFMAYVTDKRLEVIEAYENTDPDYRNFNKLQQKLNGLLSECITIATNRYQNDTNNHHFSQCVPLNDNALKKVVLYIDREQYVGDLSKLRASALGDTSIRLFLQKHDVKFEPDADYAHFYLSESLKAAWVKVWRERFGLRAENMMVPVLQTEDDYQANKKCITDEASRYHVRVTHSKGRLTEVNTRIHEFGLPYHERGKRQLANIEAYLADQQNKLSPELLALISKVKTAILFKAGEATYRHLAGTNDEPRSCWVSPQLRDKSGATLMFGPVRNEWYRTANLLLKYGLTVNASNKKGQTPATIAKMEEDELLNHIERYAREKSSQFIDDAQKIVTEYEEKYKLTLNSIWKRLRYRIFNSLEVLEERMNKEVPLYKKAIKESSQALSDFELALQIGQLSKNAKRGLLNKSKLHGELEKLLDCYMSEQHYGVKPREGVSSLMVYRGGAQDEDHDNSHAALVQSRLEQERQLQKLQQALAEKEAENMQLRGDVDHLSVRLESEKQLNSQQSQTIARQSTIIEEIEAKLKEEIVKREAQEKRVAELEVNFHTRDSEVQAMQQMIQVMQNTLLRIQAQQQQSQPLEQVVPPPSAPIDMVVRRVSVSSSTMYGSPPEESLATPSGESGSILMRRFGSINNE